MVAPKIEINQYVIFKYQDEWQEGRIVDYTHNSTKVTYKIYSLRLFTEVNVQDHILVSSPENIKKITRNIRNTGILKNEKLREMLEYDNLQNIAGKKYSSSECTLQQILNFFTAHLLENKIFLSREEICLSVEGLRDIIQQGHDEDEVKKENKFSFAQEVDEEGIVFAIKTCFLTMNHLLKYEKIQEIRNSVHVFCVYFLDYLQVNSDIFYNKSFYVCVRTFTFYVIHSLCSWFKI